MRRPEPREPAERIAERLADGRLPKHEADMRWDGYGSGEMCDGCSEAILPAHVVFALNLREPLRFHAACALIWKHMIAADARDET